MMSEPRTLEEKERVKREKAITRNRAMVKRAMDFEKRERAVIAQRPDFEKHERCDCVS